MITKMVFNAFNLFVFCFFFLNPSIASLTFVAPLLSSPHHICRLQHSFNSTLPPHQILSLVEAIEPTRANPPPCTPASPTSSPTFLRLRLTTQHDCSQKRRTGRQQIRARHAGARWRWWCCR